MSDNNYKYSKEQIEILRTVSMHDILADLGYRTEHTTTELYYSPFRDERTPSFHIDDAHHRWYDHGNPAAGLDGKGGGDTITLVMMLKKCSFYDALEYLSAFSPAVKAGREDEIIRPHASGTFEGGGITVEKVYDRFTSRLLLDYAVGKRCIPQPLMDRYCSQVSYRNNFVDRQTGEIKQGFHYAIGFRHTDGSWTLRVPPVEGSKFKGKLSTGSGFTVILADGTVPVKEGDKAPELSPGSKTVAVFEGFFDYLSWMAWTKRDVPAGSDCVVLNGVTNTKAALPFLLSHSNVVSFLDNDAMSKAGERFTDYIREQCEKSTAEGKAVKFLNNSSAFGSYKDLNEAWTAEFTARRERELRKRVEETARKRAEEKDNGTSSKIKP